MDALHQARRGELTPRESDWAFQRALLLGSEEGLEDAGLDFGGHARAGVGDGQEDAILGHRGADGDGSAGRHGVARIDDEVHDDLLDLAGIGADDGSSSTSMAS